jgi:hypothetical protein
MYRKEQAMLVQRAGFGLNSYRKRVNNTGIPPHMGVSWYKVSKKHGVKPSYTPIYGGIGLPSIEFNSDDKDKAVLTSCSLKAERGRSTTSPS